MGADVLRGILDGNGIDGRLWACEAFRWGYRLQDIADTCQVSRRTVNDWARKGKWTRKNTHGVKINHLLNRVMALQLLSAFIAPPSREFGKGAPIGNRNAETHGCTGREGQAHKAVLREARHTIKLLQAESKRIRERRPLLS